MKMQKYRIILLALLFLFGSTMQWHDNGHMIVAYIAQDYLLRTNPDALKWALDLLSPLSDMCGERYYPFIESATWADKAKSQGWKIQEPHHWISKGWSDENLPVKVDNNSLANIVYAISDCSKTLSSNKDDTFGSSKSLMGKSISLRNLIHYLGDIHQPLHTSERVSTSNPKGDQGGNLFLIDHYDPQNKYWNNMHFIWDAMFEPIENGIRGQLNRTSYQYIKTQSDTIMQEYPFQKLKGVIYQHQMPDEWAEEGKEIARSFIFKGIQNGGKLPQEYQDKGRIQCRERVALGGYRLGILLDKIYQKIKSPRQFKPLFE